MNSAIDRIERKLTNLERMTVVYITRRVLPTDWAVDIASLCLPMQIVQNWVFPESELISDSVNFGLSSAVDDPGSVFVLVIRSGHTLDCHGGFRGRGGLDMVNIMRKYPQIDILFPSEGEFHDHIVRKEAPAKLDYFMARVSAFKRMHRYAKKYTPEGSEIAIRRYITEADFTGGMDFANLCQKAGVAWWQHGGVRWAQLEGKHLVDGYEPEPIGTPSMMKFFARKG